MEATRGGDSGNLELPCEELLHRLQSRSDDFLSRLSRAERRSSAVLRSESRIMGLLKLGISAQG